MHRGVTAAAAAAAYTWSRGLEWRCRHQQFGDRRNASPSLLAAHRVRHKKQSPKKD